MTSARYGRMRQDGRCVKRDYGYVGCASDVIATTTTTTTTTNTTTTTTMQDVPLMFWRMWIGCVQAVESVTSQWPSYTAVSRAPTISHPTSRPHTSAYQVILTD